MASSAGRVLVVFAHEAGRLHDHATRTAGGIEDAAVERFDHLGEQLHDAAGCVELAAALALAHGERAEEVFVDAAKASNSSEAGISEIFLSSCFSRVLVTTTLCAALDVATGEVITQCKPRHRHQEFLGFLRQIETSVPEALDIHLVVDNTWTHKHAEVRPLAGAAAPLPCALQDQICLLAQPGGALVWDDHPAGDPARQLLQRLAEGFCEAVGTDCQNRAVRGLLQQDQGAVQLDGHRGFHPGEAPESLLANLRDGTLANLASDRISPRLVPEIEISPWLQTQMLALHVYPSPSRPQHLIRKGPSAGVYARVGWTNRRADAELIEELRRFSRGEGFDEQPMPGLDSEAIDFRVASESFAPFPALRHRGLETLRLVSGTVPMPGSRPAASPAVATRAAPWIGSRSTPSPCSPWRKRSPLCRRIPGIGGIVSAS